MRSIRQCGLAAAVSAMLLATGSGAAADPGEATHVDSLIAVRGASGITVSGSATFVDTPVQVGDDPTGDAGTSGVGADVTKAVIARPDPAKNMLEFSFEVADQPATGPSSAPVVIYTWPISVDGSSRSLFLEARSASAFQPTGASPAFLLMEETEDRVATIATLTGSMGNGSVRWTVPMSSIAAVGGSAITQGGDCVKMGTGVAAPGLVWTCNNAGGDQVFMEFDYVVPQAVVQLGIAPAGTPADQVELTGSATVQSTGAFTGTLPTPSTPGSYVVVAQACNGAGNCGLATTNITV